MKSGYDNYQGMRGTPYYDDEATPLLLGLEFRQRVFTASPALVAIHPENGRRAEQEYKGQDFAPTRWKLIEKRWDHQHCRVCQFSISEEITYWETADGKQILCDACYDHYLGHTKQEAEPSSSADR